MVLGQPNEELVRNLGPNSHLLPELEREFYRAFGGYQDSKVVSFYETKKTRTVQVLSASVLVVQDWLTWLNH